MRIESPETVDRFRHARRCEFCGKSTPGGTDPAHVFSRGRGDAWRLDVPECLVSLCRLCHTANHAGNRPNREDLLLIVGGRECILLDDLLELLWELRRLPTPR